MTMVRTWWMTMLCTSALCSSLATAFPARAQERADSSCYHNQGTPGARTVVRLLSSYQVILQRSTDSLAVEEACTLELRNPRDSVVWRGDGFNTSLHSWTGHDVDGDGRADAVLGVDTGGGNRCCWTHYLVRFLPVFRVDTLRFSGMFLEDDRRRTLMIEIIPFYDLGPSMADAPVIFRLHQFRDAQILDVTPEHCGRILSDTSHMLPSRRNEWDQATPELRRASRTATVADDNMTFTRAAVASLVMQHFACARDADAGRLVRETWPAALAEAQLQKLRLAFLKRVP